MRRYCFFLEPLAQFVRKAFKIENTTSYFDGFGLE
jgi:hypothetical protein